MRKLTYDVYAKNGNFIENVTTYKEAKEAKVKGYEVKERMTEIKEKATDKMVARAKKIEQKLADALNK